MNNACYGLEDTFDMEHNLVNTPLEGCRGVFVHEESHSLACDIVLPSPIDNSRVSTFCSQPSVSPEYSVDVPKDISELCDSNMDMGYADNMFHMFGGNVETFESLGNYSGYDVTLDPYCIYLVDKPKNILWNTFFTFSFDFSMAFALLTRTLIFLVMFIVVLSHHHACEPHAAAFDKLLRALTASALNSEVLTFD